MFCFSSLFFNFRQDFYFELMGIFSSFYFSKKGGHAVVQKTDTPPVFFFFSTSHTPTVTFGMLTPHWLDFKITVSKNFCKQPPPPSPHGASCMSPLAVRLIGRPAICRPRCGGMGCGPANPHLTGSREGPVAAASPSWQGCSLARR